MSRPTGHWPAVDWKPYVEQAKADRDDLKAALERIADPSYVGNYEAAEVVEIYRKWAQAALLADTKEKSCPPTQ